MSIDIEAEVKFSRTSDKGVYFVLLQDAEGTNIGSLYKSDSGWMSYNNAKKFTGHGDTRYDAARGLLEAYELANGLRDSQGRRVGHDPETHGFWCVLNFRGTRESERWLEKDSAISHLASLQAQTPASEDAEEDLTTDELVDASRADQDRAIREMFAGHGLKSVGFDLVPLESPAQHTITDRDIREHVVEPMLGLLVSDYDTNAVMVDLFARWPLSEWTYAELQYDHPEFDREQFNEILQRHDLTVDRPVATPVIDEAMLAEVLASMDLAKAWTRLSYQEQAAEIVKRLS